MTQPNQQALADLGKFTLNVLMGSGSDMNDRLNDLTQKAIELGLGKQNDDASEGEDPWLLTIDGSCPDCGSMLWREDPDGGPGVFCESCGRE